MLWLSKFHATWSFRPESPDVTLEGDWEMGSFEPYDQREPILNWLRRNRVVEISESPESASRVELTTFIGLYNASEHWFNIVSYLDNQTHKKCHLLIADNASSDDTWSMVLDWNPAGFYSVTKVRNPVNVGGVGNLFSNLDLVQTQWVTTCHQDDIYYANHLEFHEKLASTAASRIAMITSSMDRLHFDSDSPEPFPRLNWIANLETPADVFLTHLRFHALPFPAASFRREALEELDIPWHDTSFPDSEMVMLLASKWGFSTSSTCTMAYRENPISESHVLISAQREEGQARALLRILGSPELRKVAMTVAEGDRDDFFLHAVESVELRISDERLRLDVSLCLAEALAVSWGYGSCAVNTFIQRHLIQSGNNFGSNFFDFTLVDASDRGEKKVKGNSRHVALDPKPHSGTSLNFKRFIVRLTFKALHRMGALSARKDLDFRWRKKK